MSPLLVFNRVYRLEIQSVMLVFSTPFVPLTSSTVHTGKAGTGGGGELTREKVREALVHKAGSKIPT
jgi:hypothetical protein